jgi:GNAT superfamily N-acetyltransferase
VIGREQAGEPVTNGSPRERGTDGDAATGSSRDRGVRIQRATAADATVLARHRVEMFRDMGKLDDATYPRLFEASVAYFARAIPAGEYVAWIATPATAPDAPIAGAGLHVRALIPRPNETGSALVRGPEGIAVNVFTERHWRRRGIGARLMRELLEWARAHDIERLVLHASGDGRNLYEKMGFVPTNEMRYAGAIGPAAR